MNDALYIVNTNNEFITRSNDTVKNTQKQPFAIPNREFSWQRFTESICTEITLGPFGQAKQIYTVPWEELDLLLEAIDSSCHLMTMFRYNDDKPADILALNYIYFDVFLQKQPIYIKFDRNPISRDRLRKED